MKQKIIIVITFILFLVAGCGKKVVENDVEELKSSTPIFYKITKLDSGSTIYLLGSIHAADETAYPLNKKLVEAFNASDYLAVEVDINNLNNNLSEQIELAQKMLYIDNTTIKEHIGESLYKSMIEFLEQKNSYNNLYDSYKPIFFESLFENLIIKDANMDSDKGIDLHFLRLANEQKKQILEMETAEFQYELLLSLPIEISIMNIENYINDYDNSVSEMRNLYEAWKRGNVEELNDLIFEDDTELTNEERKLIDDYNNSLVIDRNYNMTKVLDEYFEEEKNVFCVVGLAHVIGEEGIVNLLKKQGYIIEQINYD